MERRHSIIVCEQLPLARINERSSRSFQTGPFWYRFAAAMSSSVCHLNSKTRDGAHSQSKDAASQSFCAIATTRASILRLWNVVQSFRTCPCAISRDSNAYSYRSASIGLTEAALREGRMEKTRFNTAAAANVRTALFRSKTNGNPTESLIKREVGQEIAIPTNPPPSASAAGRLAGHLEENVGRSSTQGAAG